MSRQEFLNSIFDEISHNLHCYSRDISMSKAKSGFEDSWEREKEKLELIKELIDEEKESKFKVYYPINYLYNEIDIRLNVDLAYMEDRENGTSCYLIADELNEQGQIEYVLVFNIHKKDEFDDEYENVYTRDISKESLKSRNILRKEMEKELDLFKLFIEEDKKYQRFYSRYYEEESANKNIYYLVRNDNFDVLGSFLKLNEAIIFAENKKREYMRNYNNSSVWVEIEGETEKIYNAIGYENNEEVEME